MNDVAFRPVDERARQSKGTSGDAIYRMVAGVLAELHRGRGRLLDVGCGVGNLHGHVAGLVDEYIGADVLRYDEFPAGLSFCAVDLDSKRIPLPDEELDAVVAVETIEHLENPRAFVRELTRLAKPGGWVVVTTPNNLSFLSKLTLLVKNEFNAFQAGSYPAHLTALLEVDLRRIAAECGLVDVRIAYSKQGRIPGASWNFPSFLSKWFPRAFSDNVLMAGRKPGPAAR